MATATLSPFPIPEVTPRTFSVGHVLGRRSRDPAEIIDVDELDDDNLLTLQPPPTRRRIEASTSEVSTPTEIISLVDSDEEDGQPVASGSGSGAGSSTRPESSE
jgi:hypothetical protein